MAGAGAAATVDAFSNDAEAITVSFKPAGRFEPFDVTVAALPESQFIGVRCGSGDMRCFLTHDYRNRSIYRQPGYTTMDFSFGPVQRPL